MQHRSSYTCALVAALALLAGGACTPDIPEGKLACHDKSECPGGWSCTRGYCFSKPPDDDGGEDGGSQPDAGDADAGNPPDASTLPDDGGGSDAGGDAGGCEAGFMPGASGCVDIDECETESASCDPLVKCSNTRGSYTCGKCPAGYAGSGMDGCVPQLTGLKPSTGALEPAFDPETDAYTLRVPLGRQTIALTPSAASGVTIEIEGKAVKSGKAWTSSLLGPGSNTFTLELTQSGHAKSTVSIEVVRGASVDYLKAGNADSQDLFGTSVAISDDTIVAGAWRESSAATGVNPTDPGADDNSVESGAAYVFVRDAKGWTQQAYLKAGNTELGDQFGFSVAISGDTIVVGAPGEDSATFGVLMTTTGAADNNGGDSGAAYVFVRSGETWTQQAYLKADNTGPNDGFGTRVAISGDTIAVAAPFEDSLGDEIIDQGAVYVYERSESPLEWTGPAYLKALNGSASDEFGYGLAIDGDTLIAGAPGESSAAFGVDDMTIGPGDTSAPGAGAVYMFLRDAGSWTRGSYVKASNPTAGDQFGKALAISGDTFVVGAPFEDSAAKGVDGEQEDENANAAGAAYVFALDDTSASWKQQAYLKAGNTEAFDQFGTAVAISGDLIAVGAPDEASASAGVDDKTPGPDDNSVLTSGAVYLFARGTPWSAPIYVKAINPGSGDLFGAAVSLSGDTLVCGAEAESSASRGVNSDDPGPANNGATNSGAVYVY